MQQLKHPNFDELQNLLSDQNGSYEQMRDLLLTAPNVLACHGTIKDEATNTNRGEITHYPALTMAIRHNNLGQARAILEVLGNQEYASDIMAEYRRQGRAANESPCDHPFYTRIPSPNESKKGYLPHGFVKSPEMLQLLHDHGYNLNISAPRSCNSLIERYIDDVASHINRGVPPRMGVAPLLGKAVELGMDIHSSHAETLTAQNISLAEFILNKISQGSGNARSLDKREKVFCDAITTLTTLGVDFRNIMTNGLKGNDVLCNMGSLLAKHFDNVIEQYKDSTNADERSKLATQACAGGVFPKLFAECIDHDAKAGFPKESSQLLSYIEPYWQQEYKHVIQSSEATLARTALMDKEVQDGSLARHLSKPKSTQRETH